MFDLDRFKVQLAETIAWCAPRASVDDMANSLRNLLPEIVANLVYPKLDYHLMLRLVEPVITIRSTLLEREGDIARALKQPAPTLPTGLAGGRLLIFYPGYSIYDPAAGAETSDFFNTITIPAWDTWISAGVEVDFQERSNFPYVICWIPAQFVKFVDLATQVDPTSCIVWLDQTDVPHGCRQRLSGNMWQGERRKVNLIA